MYKVGGSASFPPSLLEMYMIRVGSSEIDARKYMDFLASGGGVKGGGWGSTPDPIARLYPDRHAYVADGLLMLVLPHPA